MILGIIIAVAVVITLAPIPLTDKNVSIKTEGNDDVDFAILGDLEDILESYIKEELRPEEYNMEITTTQACIYNGFNI